MVAKTELAWAAGFFDGEGSTYICKRRRTRHGQAFEWQMLNMHITQADDSYVLYRFQSAIGGAGNVFGPYRPRYYADEWKDRWFWQLLSTRKCIEVYWMLHPWLSPIKRAQAQLCMGLMEEYWDSLRRRTYD